MNVKWWKDVHSFKPPGGKNENNKYLIKPLVVYLPNKNNPKVTIFHWNDHSS